jgi:hypothetical protein
MYLLLIGRFCLLSGDRCSCLVVDYGLSRTTKHLTRVRLAAVLLSGLDYCKEANIRLLESGTPEVDLLSRIHSNVFIPASLFFYQIVSASTHYHH